ncbi:MAG: CAP domain-containing protein [Solirubrobacteraceae bacterium]
MPPSRSFRRALFAAAITTVIAAPAAPAGAAVWRAQVPCVAGVTCPAPKPKCENQDVVPASDNVAVVRRATLCLLNVERARHDLSKLHANRPLQHVATKYAKTMVAGSFFDHVSPSGSTFVQRILASAYLDPGDGYSLGENLAWGTGILATPKRIVRAWMHSPGHRANILNGSFRDVGVGLALGNPVAGDGLGATYVNEFGAHS